VNSDPNRHLGVRLAHAIDLGEFDDPLGVSLVRAHHADSADRQVRDLIENRLRHFETRCASGTIAPFKIPRPGAGNILMGLGRRGRAIWVPVALLAAGLLLVGNTGSGKSTLLRQWLIQIAMHGPSIWMIESYKRELRQIRPHLQRHGIDLVILRPGDWRWNPLQSHLRDARVHLNTAADLLVRVLRLPSRARSILAQGAYTLYRQYGIWEGNRQHWPTLFDLYEWVHKTPGLNAAAKESILDRLGALLVALTPRVAACRRAWNPADLMGFHLDLELTGAPETVKQLLVASLLFSLFEQEVERGLEPGPLKLVLASDDGQRIFAGADAAEEGQLSPLDELAGVIRGSRISLWVVVQTMEGLSRRLIPNLATKIFGRLGCHEDYAHLGADLSLSPEQLSWARLQQRPGVFIAQLAAGSWREPFVFQTQLLNPVRPVDDAEAAASVQALERLPVEFAPEFDRWEPAHLAVVEPAASDSLSEVEMRYLRAVVEHPLQSSSAYAKVAGVNGQRAAQIRRRLVADGFLAEREVATGSRGRNAIVLEPQSKGRTAANPGGTP